MERASRKSSLDQASEEEDFLISDPQEIAFVEAQNGLLQYDAALALIEKHRHEKKIHFSPQMIRDLNRIAIQGIRKSAGDLRTGPIAITNTEHVPPSALELDSYLIELCDYVNTHWSQGSDLQDALHLSSYLMWRLNWIHPFRDGNGRTSRIISYVALCVRMGQVIQGTPAIPDQIEEDPSSYYHALDDADASWKKGELNVDTMESLISGMLFRQLSGM